jgi:hypothetical protein
MTRPTISDAERRIAVALAAQAGRKIAAKASEDIQADTRYAEARRRAEARAVLANAGPILERIAAHAPPATRSTAVSYMRPAVNIPAPEAAAAYFAFRAAPAIPLIADDPAADQLWVKAQLAKRRRYFEGLARAANIDLAPIKNETSDVKANAWLLMALQRAPNVGAGPSRAAIGRTRSATGRGPEMAGTLVVLSPGSQLTNTGLDVSDGLRSRVIVGLITPISQTPPDFGLKVVGSDGSTVLVDGTSDMFRISATGTQSVAFPAAGNVNFTNVNLSALGTGYTTPPACLWSMTYDNSAITNGRAANPQQAINISTGVVKWQAFGFISIVTGSPQVELDAASYTTNPATTAACRYWVLAQTAI